MKLRKDGYIYGGSGLKNLSTQTEEGESYLPAEDGHRWAPFIGQADRPGVVLPPLDVGRASNDASWCMHD
jgi:hypothetical protein